jgi:two-component system, chemotaxis family, sensor kinase CheA
MNLEDALPGFIAESAELLHELETGLLACTTGSTDPETIHLIFRSAHTLKGSAGLFGLEAIVNFVHVMETVLDAVRLNRIDLTGELVALLLSCKDHVQALIAHLSSSGGPLQEDAPLQQEGRRLIASLEQASGLDTHSRGPASSAAASAAEEAAVWHIVVRFGRDVLTAGMDPLGFIRYLRTLGELLRVQVLEDALPAAADYQPVDCYLGFEIDLRSTAGRARIEAAFDFVREDCTLSVTPVAAPAAQLAEPNATESVPKKPSVRSAESGAGSIRVDAIKLDNLITRIGELITATASASLAARRSGSSELDESTSTLAALVGQVRESALQLRMVKIGGTFQRFQRVVHDVARELGKEIRLVVRGEDTELDKTVVERITDPLTHLVRNAMDHGIEPADVRAAAGKPAAGRLTLNAFHDSGSIVIEVGDDGGGLKRDRILAKAIERGLADPDREWTDAEVFNFVFEPGFSTAEQVTSLSGRGVGMDVVKRNITALRGTVDIRSSPGEGTTVTVRLPLTLAIINGFLVSVGKASFVLPLESIEECVELSGEQDHDFTNLRGHVLPLVRLREIFGTAEPVPRRQSIVVVKHAGQRVGLIVDGLLGALQTVIKPLGKMFRNVDCVSGSSILGNGEVALIVDIPALIARGVSVVAAQRRRPTGGEAAKVFNLENRKCSQT